MPYGLPPALPADLLRNLKAAEAAQAVAPKAGA